jgi:hypothetical protein
MVPWQVLPTCAFQIKHSRKRSPWSSTRHHLGPELAFRPFTHQTVHEQGGRRAVVSNFRAVWPRNAFARMPKCSKLYLQTLSGTAVKPLGVTISVCAEFNAVLMVRDLLFANIQPSGICMQVLSCAKPCILTRHDFAMMRTKCFHGATAIHRRLDQHAHFSLQPLVRRAVLHIANCHHSAWVGPASRRPARPIACCKLAEHALLPAPKASGGCPSATERCLYRNVLRKQL